MKQLRYFFTSNAKALSDDRALLVKITTPTKDRAGDVVVPTGAKLDNYRKNPVVLFAHNYGELPIARAEELSITDEGITAKVVFPKAGTYERADVIYELIKQGVGNAWSIGFIPDFDTATRLDDGGYRFEDWEMLEFSFVPVPANPDALTVMRSKGFSDEVIEEVTDEKAALTTGAGEEEAEEDEKEDEEETDDEAEGSDEEEEKQVERIEVEEKKTEKPEPKEGEELTKFLSDLRDELRRQDKAIGLALRTMNHLLEETRNDGR